MGLKTNLFTGKPIPSRKGRQPHDVHLGSLSDEPIDYISDSDVFNDPTDIRGCSSTPRDAVTPNSDNCSRCSDCLIEAWPGVLLCNSCFQEDTERKSLDFCEDVRKRQAVKLAVTVNIKPTFRMNNKLWYKYDQEKQMSILTRLEAKCRSLIEDCELTKLVFEQCPSNDMTHFHALYTCEDTLRVSSKMMEYWAKFSGNDKYTKIPWRVILCDDVYDEQGWIKYITKTL